MHALELPARSEPILASNLPTKTFRAKIKKKNTQFMTVMCFHSKNNLKFRFFFSFVYHQKIKTIKFTIFFIMQ